MKKQLYKEDSIFSYAEYLPDNFDGNKKYPLIVQLHGAGERGNGKEDLPLVEVHGFSDLLEKNDYECVVVMPQCPKETFWVARIESIVAFIEQMKNRYPIDEKRVYLTGISMGGFGTWFTAMAHPKMFAAIAPVCGGGMPWNAGSLDMPVWAFHGAEDNVVDVKNSDDMVDKLKFLGRKVKYTRLDGVLHNVWDHTYDDELMTWLLSNSR